MHRDFAVAVKAVIVRGDEVLVLRRSKGEMAGSYMNKYQKWDLPGGGLHFYEKAEDGLLREIREETSLSVEIGRPVSMFDIIRHQIHLCIFTYTHPMSIFFQCILNQIPNPFFIIYRQYPCHFDSSFLSL